MDIRNWLRAQWDRALAVAFSIIGGVALLVGYIGVKDALYPGQQIPYILSGGILGIFLIGVAAALWLSADLRDEWRKLDEIDDKLTTLLERPVAEPVSVDHAEPARAQTNGRRRHRTPGGVR